MASLRNPRWLWYASVRWYQKGKQKEKQIPLRTKKRIEALERQREVESVEQDIKSGIIFDFPWLNQDQTKTRVKRFTLAQAVNQWMGSRLNNIRNNTLRINQVGVDHFLKFMGNSKPLSQINNLDIISYISYLKTNRLSNTSINIYLRTIHTMFNYYLDMGQIEKVPKIK